MVKEEIAKALQNYPVYNVYENKANVFAMFLGFDARTGTLQESLQTVYKLIVTIGRKRNFPMYMNHEDCLRVANIILEKIKTNPEWFEDATNQIYQRAEVLIKFSRQLKKEKYKTKSQDEILKLYKDYCVLFKNMRVYSSIPMMLEHDTPVLSNLLQERMRSLIEENDLNTVFSVLSSPTKYSYLLQEEQERLQIAAKKKRGEDITEEVKEHTEKWNWKEYMFEGTPLTEEDFIRQIEQDIKNYQDPQERKKEREEKQMEIKRKQQEYIVKYNLSEEMQRLAAVAQDIVYLKYFRKGIFAESYYCVEFLLREIAERLNLTIDDVRAMFDWEVEEALKDKLTKEKEREIKKRQEFCTFVSYKGKCYALTEEEAERIEKENIIEEKRADELTGQVACSGNTTGEICIVNTVEDMSKMKEGMILVSLMTHPNLFPAMKIAKGIVTDVGGLSCHAAIVARELQIPCIVGTKQATKVLKDGMRITLETSTGTIKIIN